MGVSPEVLNINRLCYLSNLSGSSVTSGRLSPVIVVLFLFISMYLVLTCSSRPPKVSTKVLTTKTSLILIGFQYREHPSCKIPCNHQSFDSQGIEDDDLNTQYLE